MTVVRPALFMAMLLWATPARAADLDHTAWDRLLKAHVSAGRVNYAALAAGGRAELSAYLQAVARADPARMGRAAELAFYLNAYNALVVGQVVARWPKVVSVKELPGFFDRHTHVVGGRTLTLNELENAVLRPRFRDPRIHFALVCAARSCPPLASEAFRGATVERALERLTRAFLRSPAGVVLTPTEVRLSRLFDWYASDFGGAGKVLAFVARYHPAGSALLVPRRRVTFLAYDWALNGR
ncbi:MAG: DUF547 domain-containing protein [Deltaproteobacteria bacterium]|nr:DUF547 domain-containing protein [Deltaproteobacteria bacterium]